MTLLDALLGKGGAKKKDVIAEIVGQEVGPQRPWDKSLASITRGRNMRELKVTSKNEGWIVRDTLNELGIESWFPEPGKTTGMIVYYYYQRDIEPEELQVLLKKFGSGGISSSSTSRPTIVSKRSK